MLEPETPTPTPTAETQPVELVRVLEGRGAGRKRTEVVEKFARLRWSNLVAEGSYCAVRRLLQEIKDVLASSGSDHNNCLKANISQISPSMQSGLRRNFWWRKNCPK